jgi:hypothetical protein
LNQVRVFVSDLQKARHGTERNVKIKEEEEEEGGGWSLARKRKEKEMFAKRLRVTGFPFPRLDLACRAKSCKMKKKEHFQMVFHCSFRQNNRRLPV